MGAGYENGLIVTLKNDYDDYFVTTHDTAGYAIQIFYSEDYPDEISGSLSEVIVDLGTVTLINLEVKKIKATENLISSPMKMVII